VRILVTGGAGYIGSFAVRALQAAGHEVVVYDNLSFGHPQAVDAELVAGDIGDAARLDECLQRGVEAVMHFAAFIEAGESMVDPGRFFANNTGKAITVLNAAVRNRIESFIFSSSAGVYAPGVPVPIKETAPIGPSNVYAESKVLVERMLPWYDRIHGLRSVLLRYFNAAGGSPNGSMGQDHEPASHIITLAIKAALGRHRFVLFGDDYPTPDGTCIRDYIHVLDLATAHVAALEDLVRGGRSDVYNIGTGQGHSNWEVVRAVQQISGVDFPVEVGPRRPGDPPELVADATKLRQTLGWQPEYSDLETIISTAWEWQRTHPEGYVGEQVAR
jgi:UDP-glucose-4-epimerase GalE